MDHMCIESTLVMLLENYVKNNMNRENEKCVQTDEKDYKDA